MQQSRDQGGQDKALLTCGTGMGMSIIANKFPDVYAAVVESVAAAGNAAAINNANVLALGGTLWKVGFCGRCGPRVCTPTVGQPSSSSCCMQ